MLTPYGKRYAVEWAEEENRSQELQIDGTSLTIYRAPIADVNTETIRFKGIMHKSSREVDDIPMGAEVWFRFSALNPLDDGTWPIIDHEGKKMLLINEDEMICWRHPETKKLIATKDKIIFEPVYESDDEIMRGLIQIKPSRDQKKSLGKAINGKSVNEGDEFVYWSKPYPVHIDLKTTIYSIFYRQYVHNRTTGHYNEEFVILKPLDEDKEWELKKSGLWLPGNADVQTGLAEVAVDNGIFHKGDTVVHSKRSFNEIPYTEKVYAAHKHMVFLAF